MKRFAYSFETFSLEMSLSSFLRYQKLVNLLTNSAVVATLKQTAFDQERMHWKKSNLNEIETSLTCAIHRRQRVKKAAEHRRNRLDECHKYMVFAQNVNEAESWIRDKLQVTKDESYRDPVNLEGKKKKHQEFEAEVNTNEQRIQHIAQVSICSHWRSASQTVHIYTSKQAKLMLYIWVNFNL